MSIRQYARIRRDNPHLLFPVAHKLTRAIRKKLLRVEREQLITFRAAQLLTHGSTGKEWLDLTGI